MKKVYFLLLFVLVLSACNPTLNTVATEQTNDYSFLALGDSYTIGEGVEIEESWPFQLVERLRERGLRVAPPKIVAQTGWTTRNLIRNMEQEVAIHREFDLVSILIGVNNQYKGRSLAEYEEQLREIFRKAISHSRQRERGVFALSIPDYGVTPFGEANAERISLEIDQFNATFRRVAEEFDVAFYNITPITREAATNPNLLANDSLHPSPLMYRFWVEEVVEDAERFLTR